MDNRISPELSRRKQERRTRWLVWAESLVILGLLVWVSIEYESNQYLQAWIGSKVSVLGFLLNGTLAGFYSGALIGYILSTHKGSRSDEERIFESLTKKRSISE